MNAVSLYILHLFRGEILERDDGFPMEKHVFHVVIQRRAEQIEILRKKRVNREKLNEKSTLHKEEVGFSALISIWTVVASILL